MGREHHSRQSEITQLNQKVKCQRKTRYAKGVTGFIFGAACRNRTDDLPLTRRVLYQLS
jgi:hypothetical protein